MRSKFPEDFFGIEEPIGGDIGVRLAEGFVKGGTIGFIEPIARVQWQQLEFRAFGQVRWFVDDQTPGTNACLDAHRSEDITERAAQALAADAARCDREAARLKRKR